MPWPFTSNDSTENLSPAEKQRRATQPPQAEGRMVPKSEPSNPTTFGKLMDPKKRRRGGLGQSNEANRAALEAAGMY